MISHQMNGKRERTNNNTKYITQRKHKKSLIDVHGRVDLQKRGAEDRLSSKESKQHVKEISYLKVKSSNPIRMRR